MLLPPPLVKLFSKRLVYLALGVLCPVFHGPVFGQANDFALPTDPLTHAAELAEVVDDQALNVIVPLSSDRIVAVGDAGIILVSENAGRSWHRVRNGNPSNLNGLAFLGEQNGIAVGGHIGNYTYTSEATVIRTEDGGFTWERVKTDLPRLQGLQNQQGRLIAWGDYSVKHRSAVFTSVDNGKSWVAIKDLGTTHVRTAHQSANGDTIIVDQTGKAFLRLQSGKTLQLRALNAVTAVHHTGREWVAIGDAGGVLMSQDGQVWRPANLPFEAEVQNLCDWKAIAQVGQHLWVGGFPGTVMLHSSDLGATWQIESTDQRLPIHGICFLDEARGWIAGPMGAIHATRNGTQWFPQRNADRSIGVLCLAPTSGDVPWASLVGCAWDKGISCGVQFLPLANLEDPDEFTPSSEACVEDAIGKLGVVTTGKIQPRLNGSQPDRDFYENRLQLMLQSWRPHVVVVAHDHEDTQWSLKANSLLDAARKAMQADSKFSTLLSSLGKEKWAIEKIVQAVPLEQARFSERKQRILKRLGLSIADVLLPLPPGGSSRPASGLVTTWSASRNLAARNEFLGACSFGNSTRRKFASDELGNYQLVMGRVHLKNSIEQLSELETRQEAWLQNLELILQSLPQKDAVPTLLALAQRLGEQGKHERQQIVFERIIANFPKTDAARFVMLKSLELASSDEHAAWRQSEFKRRSQANQVAFATSAATESSTTAWSGSPFASDHSGGTVVGASNVRVMPNVTPDPVAWFQALAAYNQLLPNLDARPDVKLGSYQMACKLSGSHGDNLQKLESLIHASELPNWSRVAIQEFRNANNTLGQDDLVGLVAWTDERPVLDGQLDESFWGAIPPMQLFPVAAKESTSGLSRQSSIRWAYDHQYLYMGIACQHLEDKPTAEPPRTRTYDSDLSQNDHLEIVLDVDRDYQSAIQLGIAKDGRTFDRCCGNQAFNPKWHVFVKQTQDEWIAEIAIEAKYLTTEKDLVGKSWGASVRRRQGATNVATWQHGSSQDLELRDNGLLLFLPNE